MPGNEAGDMPGNETGDMTGNETWDMAGNETGTCLGMRLGMRLVSCSHMHNVFNKTAVQEPISNK